MIRASEAIRVADASQVAAARRVASRFAESLRMSETAVGHAALVATELATNLIKHGDGGWLLLGADELRPKTLVMIAYDKGRGIANVPMALQDGYSTAGSPGTGLGAIYRAASAVDLYTLPERGTFVHCVIADNGTAPSPLQRPPRMIVGGLALPKPEESANGDSWAAVADGDIVTVGIADGLGHGPVAATASAAAARVIAGAASLSLPQLMQDAHAALRSTRGAAVGVARIDPALGRVDFVGVGNIAGTIVTDDGMRKTVSLPGIVGHEMRKVQTFSYPWAQGSVLILHSDGISGSWSTAAYPGLVQHPPALIASVLYRDFCRGTDDATVVVAKAV